MLKEIIVIGGQVTERDMTQEEIDAMTSPRPTNEEIKQLREQEYKLRSDSLYIAYKKYEEQGDARAEQAKQLWLDEIRKIEDELPYL